VQATDPASLYPTVVWSVFVVASVLGAVMNRTNFCTMGAISDVVNVGDWTRMRMWAGAIGTAMIGVAVLAGTGIIDLSRTFYTAATMPWLSMLLGGLAFGFGMVLASGCGSKTLVRIGGGSLKSLVVFVVLGIAAYMTLRGLIGVWRVSMLDPVAVRFAHGQDLPRLFAGADAAATASMRLWLGLAMGAALWAFALAGREFRQADPLMGALVVGAAIIAGWYISGRLGYVAEDPKTLEEAFVATNSGRMESFTFVAPVAYSLELLMLWSDKSKVVTFGVAAVAGMIVGSAVYALASRTFRWEGFRDTEDTANHLVGAVLMGAGGVTALGCTVGQGLTGLSTLALGSFIAFAGIVVGAVLALKYQIWRLSRME
jgi:hypothetical protein